MKAARLQPDIKIKKIKKIMKATRLQPDIKIKK